MFVIDPVAVQGKVVFPLHEIVKFMTPTWLFMLARMAFEPVCCPAAA